MTSRLSGRVFSKRAEALTITSYLNFRFSHYDYDFTETSHINLVLFLSTQQIHSQEMLAFDPVSGAATAKLGLLQQEELDAWEKQVLSARGFKRVGRHS